MRCIHWRNMELIIFENLELQRDFAGMNSFQNDPKFGEIVTLSTFTVLIIILGKCPQVLRILHEKCPPYSLEFCNQASWNTSGEVGSWTLLSTAYSGPSIFTRSTFQMSLAYSPMVRSLENLPADATLSMHIFNH